MKGFVSTRSPSGTISLIFNYRILWIVWRGRVGISLATREVQGESGVECLRGLRRRLSRVSGMPWFLVRDAIRD